MTEKSTLELAQAELSAHWTPDCGWSGGVGAEGTDVVLVVYEHVPHAAPLLPTELHGVRLVRRWAGRIVALSPATKRWHT